MNYSDFCPENFRVLVCIYCMFVGTTPTTGESKLETTVIGSIPLSIVTAFSPFTRN